MGGSLVCRSCSAAHPANEARWRCECGGLLDLDFAPDLDFSTGWGGSLWGYRNAFPPLRDESIVSLGEGRTPLVETEADGARAFLKLDYLFPTGSYKDRGASVMISQAKEWGAMRVVEDSSGNAGCAVAAYCAKAGIACDIFVPESASPGKLAQIRAYGATLRLVPGSREAVARAALQAAETALYASHVWNPFFFQGTKTLAYELWEQLGSRAPDAVVLPAGNGTLLIGAHLGFRDLLRAGRIAKPPRLIAVQAANCAPLHAAYRGASTTPPAATLAEGIAIAAPARLDQMLEAVRETGGEVIAVTEDEIRAAALDLGARGHYVEPTSATAWAGFRRLSFQEEETVAIPLTGSGLKSGGRL
jgi:threonine synthase